MEEMKVRSNAAFLLSCPCFSHKLGEVNQPWDTLPPGQFHVSWKTKAIKFERSSVLQGTVTAFIFQVIGFCFQE